MAKNEDKDAWSHDLQASVRRGRALKTRVWLALLILVLSTAAWAQEDPQKTMTVGEFINSEFGGKQEFVGPVLPAAEGEAWKPDAAAAWGPDEAFFKKFQQVAVVCVFICLLASGVLWMMNKLSPSLITGRARKKFVTVLERQSIGPNRAVHTLKVGNKILVVGMTDHNMQTLCEMTPEEYEAAVAAEEEPATESEVPAAGAAREGYSKILQHYLSILPKVGVKNES